MNEGQKTKEMQIEEMAQIICGRSKDDICLIDKTSCDSSCRWARDAEALYNAGYQKIDEFAECRNCTAWSGTDCTRHPYTQGCLKDENNIKRQAVKEFAEKLWNKIKDNGIDYKIGLRALGEEIDELLKEHEE